MRTHAVAGHAYDRDVCIACDARAVPLNTRPHAQQRSACEVGVPDG